MTLAHSISILAAWLCLAGAAAAAPAADPPKREPLPSLDELLGLPNAAPRASDRDARALDQKLSNTEEKADLEQAVELMAQSADRLVAQQDPGLPTQRLQEDVLRKLDKLIAQAEQNQQQSRSKSKQKQQQQQNQQAQQQKSQQEQNADEHTGPQSEATPPGKLDARPNALSPAAQAAWGNLPDHVRQALVQGASDRFSSLYQSLTEAYYRRLAEEPRENAPR